jgi:hypothetical protein
MAQRRTARRDTATTDQPTDTETRASLDQAGPDVQGAGESAQSSPARAAIDQGAHRAAITDQAGCPFCHRLQRTRSEDGRDRQVFRDHDFDGKPCEGSGKDVPDFAYQMDEDANA